MRIEEVPDLGSLAIRDGKKRLVLSSATERGLTLLVKPNRRKEWHLRYTLTNGARSTCKVGDYPALSFEEARLAAQALREKVRNGIDPVAEKRRQRDRERSQRVIASMALDDSYGFAAVAMRFLEHKSKTIRLSSVKKYRQSLNVHLLPEFSDVDVRSFDRLAYEQFLSSLTSRSVSAARLAHAAARAVLSFAVDEGRIAANPLLGASRFTKMTQVSPRTVTLTSVDIHALLTNCYGLPDEIHRACVFQLRSGLRIGEIVAIDWSDVDLKARILNHSATIMKSGLAAQTVLPDQMRRLLAEQRRLSLSNGDRLFSPGITADSVARSLNRGGLNWRTHDLRRTMRSHLQRMGCPQEIREAITNHSVPSGVAKHYDHGETQQQQLHWLTLWGAELDRVIEQGPAALDDGGIGSLENDPLLEEFGDLL